jgi:hypothetical protein
LKSIISKYISFILLCYALQHLTKLHAQEHRGSHGVDFQKESTTGETYAIIVGISNYPFITPLNYAADDAILFYNFLLSQDGANINPNNIRLFLNNEATAAAIMTKGISWIQNTIKPKSGDRVYFYFAGHGDAVDASEAYFLAYDANPAGDKNNYSVSGTLNVQVLKNRIKKLTQNGVEVLFIVDACRTDDIPGGLNGLAGNYESILEQKNGELMMLSASPNQYSYEDARFGNGHGLFTWHLVNGLSGEADQDGDQQVSLFELDNYVRMKVRNDSKQFNQIQTPVFCCSNDYETIVSNVNTNFLAQLNRVSTIKGTNKTTDLFLASRAVAQRNSFANEELENAYFEITQLLSSPGRKSFHLADSIYSELLNKHNNTEVELIRDYYTTALMDQVQRAINSIMNKSYRDLGDFDPCDYFETHYNYLFRAIEINKESNPEMLVEYQNRLDFLSINMWFDDKVALSSTYGPDSKSITYKYKGEIIQDDSLNVIKENVERCNRLIKNGYDNALVHYTMARLYERLKIYDKSAEYAKEAIKRAPNWPKPYSHIIKSFVAYGEMDSAEHYALKQFDLDTSVSRYSNLASYYRFNTIEDEKIRTLYTEEIHQGLPPSNWAYGDLYLMRYYDKMDQPDSAIYYYNIRKIYEYFPQKSFIATQRYDALMDTIQYRLTKGDTTMQSLAALLYLYHDIFNQIEKAEKIEAIATNYYPSSLTQYGYTHSDFSPAFSFNLSLGELYMSLNSVKAEVHFLKAEEFKQTDSKIHWINPKNRLLAFYQQNNLNEKQLEFELDRFNEKRSTVNAIRLAQVYSNLNDKLSAKKYLEIALEHDPYWYSRMYHISKIYKEIGEDELSEKYYRRALELGYHPKRIDDLNTIYGTVVNLNCE